MCTDRRPIPLSSNPEPRPPVHLRTTEAFQKLVRLEQSDSLSTRIASQFLGTDETHHHFLWFGELRTALLYGALDGFLAEQGWTVAGSLGFSSHRPGREEIARPEIKSLRLSEELWLEAPSNLQVYLERGEERAVVSFSDAETPSPMTAVGVLHRDSRPRLLEAWKDNTRRHNVLRGLKLLADGRLAPRCEDGEQGRLFMPAALRQRIDQAVRRFVSPAARKVGLRRRAGLILSGPPGTGKSSLGRELAEKVPCTFIWATPGNFGDAADVHELFEIARWLEPTVLFLEDIDLIAESRERFNPGNQLLGALMNELDGTAGDRPILTIATTNRLAVVEEAVTRPGRFDQILTIEPPDEASRRELLAHRLREAEVAPEDLEWVAAALDGATGAEIEEVATGALADSVLENEDSATEPAAKRPIHVRRAHFEAALESVARPGERRAVGFGKEA